MMRPRCIHRSVGPGLCSLLAAVALSAAPAVASEAEGGAAVAPAGHTTTRPDLTESQRKAAVALQGMADYLAGLPAFSVALRSGYDAVQASGQKIEFGETRRVTLARPDRLRVEQVASNGARDLVVLDGRNISALNADDGVYAQVPQPGGLDDALGYLVRELRIRMPLALLLTTRLPSILDQRVKTLDYVESTEILGVRTHHVAGRTDNVDFQFWIAEGDRPLPRRVVITYPQSPGQPQFWASFADWDTNPRILDTTFKFVPPQQAKQIPFAVQVRRADATGPSPAASGEVQP